MRARFMGLFMPGCRCLFSVSADVACSFHTRTLLFLRNAFNELRIAFTLLIEKRFIISDRFG